MAETSRERPSRHGAILGQFLADVAKAGAVGTDLLSAMCGTCAFRDGCMTNQMAATGIEAMNIVLGVDSADFACHHGMKDGEPQKYCAGAAAAKRAPFDVVKAALATMAARIDAAAGPDEVRASFDAWAAEVDPDGAMDDYRRARLYARIPAPTLASEDGRG